jgi:hypothetical protein
MCSNNPLLPYPLRLSPLTLHTLAWTTWLTKPRYAATGRSMLLLSFSLLFFPPRFCDSFGRCAQLFRLFDDGLHILSDFTLAVRVCQVLNLVFKLVGPFEGQRAVLHEEPLRLPALPLSPFPPLLSQLPSLRIASSIWHYFELLRQFFCLVNIVATIERLHLVDWFHLSQSTRLTFSDSRVFGSALAKSSTMDICADRSNWAPRKRSFFPNQKGCPNSTGLHHFFQ